MRWEYATAPLISHALQQILNQWGSDGWELVAVQEMPPTNTPSGAPAPGARGTLIAFFKRPVPDS